MNRSGKIIIAFLLFIAISCNDETSANQSVLNGVWEDADRDYSTDTRITSTFRWGRANILRLHSFVFFLNTPEMVFVAQNEAFIITEVESLARNRVRLTCFPQGSSSDNLYTFVFKVLNDTTIEFLAKESSTPLFPARLKKGGEVFP